LAGLDDRREVLLENVDTDIEADLRGFDRHTARDVGRSKRGDEIDVGLCIRVRWWSFAVVFAE
jgi:hypothetical protein